MQTNDESTGKQLESTTTNAQCKYLTSPSQAKPIDIALRYFQAENSFLTRINICNLVKHDI
jgi:hypothetical protein